MNESWVEVYQAPAEHNYDVFNSSLAFISYFAQFLIYVQFQIKKRITNELNILNLEQEELESLFRLTKDKVIKRTKQYS